MAERLHDTYSDRARIIRGDGTDTGLPSGEFSAVVCFTMLHHIPTAGLQDRLFAEAFRVLRSRRGVRRQRQCLVNPVPSPTFPRYLQSGVT